MSDGIHKSDVGKIDPLHCLQSLSQLEAPAAPALQIQPMIQVGQKFDYPPIIRHFDDSKELSLEVNARFFLSWFTDSVEIEDWDAALQRAKLIESSQIATYLEGKQDLDETYTREGYQNEIYLGGSSGENALRFKDEAANKTFAMKCRVGLSWIEQGKKVSEEIIIRLGSISVTKGKVERHPFFLEQYEDFTQSPKRRSDN